MPVTCPQAHARTRTRRVTHADKVFEKPTRDTSHKQTTRMTGGGQATVVKGKNGIEVSKQIEHFALGINQSTTHRCAVGGAQICGGRIFTSEVQGTDGAARDRRTQQNQHTTIASSKQKSRRRGESSGCDACTQHMCQCAHIAMDANVHKCTHACMGTDSLVRTHAH